MAQSGWKKSKRKRLSSIVALPSEFAALNLTDDETSCSEEHEPSELQTLWSKFCTSESSNQQLTCLKEVNTHVLRDDISLTEGERGTLQRALAWLLLSPESSHQVRSITIKIQAALGEDCPPLEAGLQELLSSPAPASPATLQLLEFLADHPHGRRLLLHSLPQLMLFLQAEIGHQSQTICALTSPVELAAATVPGQRSVRLLMAVLQGLQPLSPAYDLETVRSVRDHLERLLTLPALPWDLRGNCGMAYVLLCLAADDRDLRATVINAAFPAAGVSGQLTAPVPVSGWPLAAQLALLAGCVHALPADPLLVPAGGGSALLSLLTGWLVHTGMSVSDTSTMLGFARAVLSALARVAEASSGAEAKLDLQSLLPDVLVQDLLQYVWRLMGDDAQAVRNVGVDVLSALITLFAGFPDGPFLSGLTGSVLSLPQHLRRRCRALRCLLPALGVSRLLAACPALPRQLVSVLCDPAVSSHAVDLYCLLLSDHWHLVDRPAWLSTWVDPLFESDALPPAALSQITRKIAQLAPGSAAYVAQRVAARRRLPRHLWLVLLTAVQAAHRQGALLGGGGEESWRDALPLARLREALRHRDDQVRLAALTVLADSRKTSQLFEPVELQLIVRFVAANLANQTPAFRQQLMALLKKILVRLSDGTAALLRQVGDAERRPAAAAAPASDAAPAAPATAPAPASAAAPAPASAPLPALERLQHYQTCLRRLFDLPFAGLFPGANFPRRTTCLHLLTLIEELFGHTNRPVMCTVDWWQRDQLFAMLYCLTDCYENNKEMALQLLSSHDLSLLELQDGDLESLLSSALALASSPRPPDSQTAAYLLRAFVRLPAACVVLRRRLTELSDTPDRDAQDDVSCSSGQPADAVAVSADGGDDAARGTKQARVAPTGVDQGQADPASAEQNTDLPAAAEHVTRLHSGPEQTEATPVGARQTNTDSSGSANDEASAVAEQPGPASSSSAEPVQSAGEAGRAESVPAEPVPAEPQQAAAEVGPAEPAQTAEPQQAAAEAGRLLLELLLSRLQSELVLAESALTAAAATAPMHGLLLCVRLLLMADPAASAAVTCVPDWRGLGSLLVSLCRRASDAVLPVVSSSSPEGHLPMDLRSEAVMKLEAALSRALTPAAAPADATRTQGVTAQVLLICCWRTMKEVCLLLGDISQRMPVTNCAPSEAAPGLLTPPQLLQIGRHFLSLLAETRHRGAFEQAHVGFSRVCTTLWKSPLPELNEMPGRWLEEVIADIRGEGRQTLCSTRRSAGLPFLMQALLTSEPSVIGSAYFSRAMVSLLSAAAAGGDTSVHAMNVLRALFRDARLGDSVGVHVATGIKAAVTGFKADTCAERNSASLLFAALVTRVFGVQRSRDSLAKKNCMTGRLFFLRYPELYPFLLEEMAQARDPFPVLLLLARLYPSPVEGSDSQYPLRAFLPSLQRAAGSPVLQARQLAARAVCSLLPYSGYPEATLALLEQVETDGVRRQNQLHGRLLQVLYMLRHCVLETSVYTPADLLRWRPVADRCLQLAGLLRPLNPCPVTAAATCDALAAAARLGAILSAPAPPPAVAAAARELLSRPPASLYGSETAQVAAVSLLWTVGAETSVDVSRLAGYEPLQRHLQLLAERLTLQEEAVSPADRLSPVARPPAVPDVPGEAGGTAAGAAPPADRAWLEQTAAALRRRLAAAEAAPLPPPCLQALLDVLTRMGAAAAADWEGPVCDVVRRLAATETAAAEVETEMDVGKKVKSGTVTEVNSGTETAAGEEATARVEVERKTAESELPEVAVLYRAAAAHEHVRAALVRLAVGVMDRLGRQIQDREEVVDAWCRLVWRCSAVDGSVALRHAACQATAAALLWPAGQLTVSQQLTMWKCMVTLLVDDEADIRDSSAEVVDTLDHDREHSLEEEEEGDSWEDGRGCILHRAVTVFCTRMSPLNLRLTIHTLLHWIFTDDDGGQMGRLQDEDRVFDKGEMNVFSEDVLLVRAACSALLTLLPELPEQPVLLAVSELAPLPLVHQLPDHYQLELSDLLRQAARQADAELRQLTPGALGLTQRGRALLCVRAFRRLRLAAGLREFFLEPEVDELWRRSVARLQTELCFRPLWTEVVDS